jgi:hypothetical protein
MFRKYFLFLTCFFPAKFLIAQANDFKIITQDVENFWEAVDHLKTGTDTIQIFQTLVIDRASDEFKVFIKKWKIKATDYAYQIKRYPNFYRTLREHSYKLITAEDSIRTIVSRFKHAYPTFKNADICIAFGNFNTGGNIEIENHRNLIYIGLEYHGLDSNTMIRELNISTQDYVSRSNFFRTIIHEHVHVQQRTHGKKIINALNGELLANRILSEGIPEFIGQLLVPYGNDGNYVWYGLKNEKELKLKLKPELWKKGSGSWFGGDDSLFINIPRDLGYFMGSSIGKSYFEFNSIKTDDLTPLIEIKDLEKFIVKSNYFDKQ